MKKKDKTSTSQTIELIFTGIFVLIFVGFVLFLGGNLIRGTIEYYENDGEQSITQNSQGIENFGSRLSSSVQNFVLKPGQKPVMVETNGQKFRWEHYQIGNEGLPIILIRFTFVDGEVTAWENISNQHFRSSQLPDSRSIQAVEFGVPKEGRTEGLEIKI